MYDLKQLIEMFEIPERTIRRHIKSGLLIGEKKKNKWFYSEEDIKKYLDNPEVSKTIRNKSIIGMNDYFYGFSKNSNDICLIKHIKGMNPRMLKNFSSFINNSKKPFKFSLTPLGMSHTMIFIGDITDALNVLNFIKDKEYEKTI